MKFKAFNSNTVTQAGMIAKNLLDRAYGLVVPQLAVYSSLLFEEMKLPDIKGRHLFTARFRIVIFILTWVALFLFFPAIWQLAPIAPLVFNAGFLLTAVCYYCLIKYNKPMLSMVFLEIFADVMSQTALIYVLGMHGWAPYLIYGLYVVAVGILLGYYAALVASVLIFVSYYALLAGIIKGVVSFFVYPTVRIGYIDLAQLSPYLSVIFLPVALIGIVYAVRIANDFSKVKEQVLERRNIQLTALNHIGSTIRRVLNAPKVIDEVLKAVIQGLGFEVCILALVKPDEHHIHISMPEGNYYTMRLEEILGQKYHGMVLPLGVKSNSINLAIRRNRVLVRNNFAEIVYGIHPEIPMHRALRAQKVLGFKKFVITPLVAEQKVIGAILGASKKNYIEDMVIDTLDHFANQAALAIESAQLIDVLELKNKELVEANKVKSEFLAIMSHELRTPLNAVIGYTEALIDGVMGGINDDQSKSLKEVLRNGQNLLDLINSILDLAKLESGKMDLIRERFDLVELTHEVVSSLQPLVEKKSQKLRVHPQEKMPLILADVIKVRQIIINLVGNAIKFTGAQGEIDIFLEYHSESDDLCGDIFKGEKITDDIFGNPAFLIRVRDTGVGIRESDLDHIFDLFKQGDSSFTRSHEGTGLGLALTKQLVLLHRGLIGVTSQSGRGSEFRILLPQIPEQL